MSLVAHVSSHGVSTFTTASIITTGATLLVAIAGYTNAGSPTISDSKGNTWILLVSEIGSASTLSLWYCLTPTGGTGHTFTATGGTAVSMCIAAFDTATTYDIKVANAATGITLQAGSITPNNNNSLIISAASGSAGVGAVSSINSSFNITDNETGPGGTTQPTALAYFLQSAAAALNPTWTFSSGSTNGKTINAVFYPGPSTIPEVLSDSLSISDKLTLGYGDQITDSLSLSDFLSINAPIFGINLSDSLNISDFVALTYGLILSEQFTLSDLANPALSLMLVNGDSISLSDAMIFLIGVGLAKSDSLSLSDILKIAAQVVRSLGDNILLSDFLAALIGQLPAYSDTFALSDVAKIILSLGFTQSDTLSLSDAVQLALVNVLRLVESDSLNLSDSLVVNSSGPLDQYIRHWLNDVPR